MADSALGIDTPCGAHALVGTVARRNTTITQRLVNAGAIILGKANLTHFCGLNAAYQWSRLQPNWWPDAVTLCLGRSAA